MFLFIFNNSTCASSRDLTWLCVVIRIFTLHHVLYRIGGSCSNCGVSRTTNGLCSRCLDLPYCNKCRRHLNQSAFNGERRHICQVHLHVTITCIFCIPVQIGLLFDISLSLHVLSSVSAYRTVKNDVPYDELHSITS